MNNANAKWLPVLQPAANSTGAASTAEIDTLGYGYLELLIMLGATDAALSVLKVVESDTTGDGSAVDITGLVFGTSNTSEGVASVLPAANDDNKAYLFNVDLKGRKRFLTLKITAGTSTGGVLLAAIARLSRAAVAPKNAAGFNVSQALQCPAY